MIATNKFLDKKSAPVVLPDTMRLSPFRYSRTTDEAVKAARILIVDDEPSVARIVQKHLQDAGFRNFDLLADARQTFEHVTQTSPDLVLLDINMAPANGLQILEALRIARHTEHTPVVILTHSSDEATKLTALNLGANDFLTKPVTASELVARVRNTLSAKAYRDKVADYTLQLESDVLCDALTGIPNRRAFDYELKRRMSEWQRQKTPLALLMIDIDHFKLFNDRYGHAVGDTALRKVASVLKSTMRDMDLVARYGGEEFAVILPSTDSINAVQACLQAQFAISESLIDVEGKQLSITASAGMAVVTTGDDADLLLRRADTALYAAKQNGRDCCFQHVGAKCIPLSESAGTDRQTCFREPHTMSPSGADIHSARIAIIDDEPSTIALARKYLRDDGFSVFFPVSDSTQAMDVIRREVPDLVLLDLRMPTVNGFDILHEMRSEQKTRTTPVLVLTATKDKQAKVEALTLGATDFLEKPLHPNELIARIHNTLLAKKHVDVLKDYSARLEYEVQLRTTELTASRREAVQCLARAAELRDDVTGRHVIRVGRFAAIIARELGFSEERILWMEHAAQLHDVGKIGVPDAILHKPGKLTEAEFEIIKGHCVAGRSIIRDEVVSDDVVRHLNVFDDCNSPMMSLAAVVAGTHHEKWDGTGYPQGLKGTDIPIEGRITAVADVFDALSTRRPYKPAIPLDECFHIMEEKRGSHFDPTVLDAFIRRRSEVVQTATDLADPR